MSEGFAQDIDTWEQDPFKSNILTSGPVRNLYQRLNGILALHPGAYVPAWSAIVVAVERTDQLSSSKPFLAITDTGGAIYADPIWNQAEDAFGDPLPWPQLGGGEPTPVEAVTPEDDDEAYSPTPPVDEEELGLAELAEQYKIELGAAVLAAAVLAYLALR
jgi:hypothetical protein